MPHVCDPQQGILILVDSSIPCPQGLGARLLAAQLARLEAGSRVELLAAAQAVPFYLRQGFEVQHKGEKMVLDMDRSTFHGPHVHESMTPLQLPAPKV